MSFRDRERRGTFVTIRFDAAALARMDGGQGGDGGTQHDTMVDRRSSELSGIRN